MSIPSFLPLRCARERLGIAGILGVLIAASLDVSVYWLAAVLIER